DGVVWIRAPDGCECGTGHRSCSIAGRIDETSQPGIPRIRSEHGRRRAIPNEPETHLGIGLVVISVSLPAKDLEAFDAVARYKNSMLPAGSRSTGKQTLQGHQGICQWKVSTVGPRIRTYV